MSNARVSQLDDAQPIEDVSMKTTPGTLLPFDDEQTSPDKKLPDETARALATEENPVHGDEADENDALATVVPIFDGQTAPEELTLRDLSKVVQAPMQNRAGRRARYAYEQIIKQFAVGTNPRYDADGPNGARGHVFIWDVSRAMNCEIPHFEGSHELSLEETCAWLRNEGAARGWRTIPAAEAIQMANDGRMVIALADDVRPSAMALVPPQELQPSGAIHPRVAGAGQSRGALAESDAILGAGEVIYFGHD